MRVALIGNPNIGKSTLFNQLTRSGVKTVNFPGSTVVCYEAKAARKSHAHITFIDTPGLYSFSPLSSEEKVTRKVLFNEAGRPTVDAVVFLMKPSQLRRKLIMLHQLKMAGVPFVVMLVKEKITPSLQNEIDGFSAHFNAPFLVENNTTTEKLLNVLGGLDPATEASALPAYTPEERQTIQQNLIAELKLEQQSAVSNSAFYCNFDKLFLHPIWGLLAFILIMAGAFSLVFWLSSPLTDFMDTCFTNLSNWLFVQLGDNLFSLFVAKGLVVAFGASVLFLPQIFLLFFVLGLLEQSGYLPRAAVFLDRPFQWLGVSGKAFLPVISGFGCAIPAIYSTRMLSSKREKLIAILVLPLMVCSARLPIYSLILAFLFGSESSVAAGLVLTGLYVLALVNGAIAAKVLNKFIKKDQENFFMMELPSYRWPNVKQITQQVLRQCKRYITGAAPMILAFTLGIFALSTFPNYDKPTQQERFRYSYLADAGKAIEPIFEPLGVDWRVGAGLLSSFVAREVFISSQALLFNASEEDEQESILKSFKDIKKLNGTPLFNTANILAILVFFIYALQCFSTTVVTARETKSWRLALLQLLVYNSFAYVLAVITYQVLSRL